jgi:O-antigen ligase
MLILTHTRTALIGMMAGILVAGLSLFIAEARVRKVFATAGVLLSVAAVTLSSVLTTWLSRGENSQQLTSLTGRTPVWQAVLNAPRNWFGVLFGSGLSNNSFGGLAIDSNWLAAYSDQGVIGVGIVATMVLFVFVAAYFQPPGVRRALPLFLLTYCLVASFTETGLSQPSSYMLELTLAASLLVPYAANRPSA